MPTVTKIKHPEVKICLMTPELEECLCRTCEKWVSWSQIWKWKNEIPKECKRNCLHNNIHNCYEPTKKCEIYTNANNN